MTRWLCSHFLMEYFQKKKTVFYEAVPTIGQEVPSGEHKAATTYRCPVLRNKLITCETAREELQPGNGKPLSKQPWKWEEAGGWESCRAERERWPGPDLAPSSSRSTPQETASVTFWRPWDKQTDQKPKEKVEGIWTAERTCSIWKTARKTSARENLAEEPFSRSQKSWGQRLKES